MIRRYLSLAVICLSCSLNAGCASIVNGDTQSLSVETPPVTGAICSLSNDKGSWFVNGTPGSVTVHKSAKNLLVSCQKLGYPTYAMNVAATVEPMLFGNILFGGPVGIGVDAIDGAAYKYPTNIQIPMEKQ
jgi:hypothetical protein